MTVRDIEAGGSAAYTWACNSHRISADQLLEARFLFHGAPDARA